MSLIKKDVYVERFCAGLPSYLAISTSAACALGSVTRLKPTPELKYDLNKRAHSPASKESSLSSTKARSEYA